MGLFSAAKLDSAVASVFSNAVKKSDLVAAKDASEPQEDAGSASASVSASASDISGHEGSDSEPDSEPDSNQEEQKEPRKRKAEETDDLEEGYFKKLLGAKDAPKKEAKETKPKDAKKDVTTDEKEKLTVFVGNVPHSVISDKQQARAFKQLFTEAGKVVSLRFRSIAFSEPLPRKAAFITQKLHDKRDAVNAYVVFATEAGYEEALQLNGVVFDDHHLRIDSAAKPTEHNRKRSIFVGNLDFEANEEALYRHFMGCGDIEYVRIVRDQKTNVGKGFAYIQFQDPTAVHAALLLNNKDFSGRPLRVSHSRVPTASPSTKILSLNDRKLQKQQLQLGRTVQNKSTQSGTKAGTKAGTKGRKPSTRSKPGNTVLEGNRAKTGDKTGLGRKRKPRHRNDPTKKRRTK